MKSKIKLLVFSVIFISFSIITINSVNARPGGGHSYSNSSNSSSNNSDYSSNNNTSNYSSNESDYESSYNYSSDSDSSGAPWYVNVLSFIIMLAVLALNAIAFTAFQKFKAKILIISSASKTIISEKNEKLENNLQNLKKADPNFSKTLFIDFVSSFYNKYYTWLGKNEFKNLTPFLSSEFIEKSKKYKYSISEIVIGSITISEITLNTETQKILVEINANYTITKKGKKIEIKLRREVVDKWLFVRLAGILSHDPNKMLFIPKNKVVQTKQ